MVRSLARRSQPKIILCRDQTIQFLVWNVPKWYISDIKWVFRQFVRTGLLISCEIRCETASVNLRLKYKARQLVSFFNKSMKMFSAITYGTSNQDYWRNSRARSLKLINKITVFSMTCSPLQVTDGYLSSFNDSLHPNDPINGVKLQFVEDF